MPSCARLHYLCALFAILVVSFVLAGCGKGDAKTGKDGKGENPKVTKENFDKVKDTMSEKEVIEILGAATESKDIDGGKGREHTWKSGMNSITIGFRDGKIESKSQQFVTVK